MIKGECLCGAVQFEATSIIGPFELCHCSRCRTSTGSAYAAIVRVAVEGFRFTAGTSRIRLFELPVVERPPGYRRFFCDDCGSPVPNPNPNPSGEWVSVPAGSLKTNLGGFPERHIYVDHKADWDRISDGLPQLTGDEVVDRRLQVSTARFLRRGKTGTLARI
jgi:hypothetical protein